MVSSNRTWNETGRGEGSSPVSPLPGGLETAAFAPDSSKPSVTTTHQERASQYAGSLAGLRHVVGDGTPDRRDLKDPAPSNHAPVSRPVLASTVAYDVPTATTPESEPRSTVTNRLASNGGVSGETSAREENQ